MTINKKRYPAIVELCATRPEWRDALLHMPQVWQQKIRRMCEAAEMVKKVEAELYPYLVQQGLTDEKFESGCALEDAIIDSQRNGDWVGLLKRIEQEYAEREEQNGG